MRITTHRFVIVGLAFGLGSVATPLTSFANEPRGAHAMAHQFANAHDAKPAPDPTKTNSKNAIQPNQVEGAFQARSQENELKTTDQILESIEARTRAIEALLEESTSDKWNVYAGKPDSVVVEAPTRSQSTTHQAAANTQLTTPAASSITARATTTEPTIDLQPPARTDWAATTTPVTAPDRIDGRIQNDPQHDARSTSPVVDPAMTTEPARDITELPEPGYALGGPGNLRHGLAEASSILSTATVLLKLKPGNTGLRRFKKTADPVLCGRRHCYMSKGFDDKAYRMLRGTALGPFNTLGRRAGACRQRLTCAFRYVDLMDDGVLLQPVDLKFMRHDRRAYRNIKADPTCKLSSGRLHCAQPIEAKTWTAWIVPEHIAMEAGSDALETALQDGLPEQPIPSIHVERAHP